MSVVFQYGEAVKQALSEKLQHILSPNNEIREAAEKDMKHLEVTEGLSDTFLTSLFDFTKFNYLGYGVFLAEIIMNQSFDTATRQLACIMLTKYVEENWHNMAEDVPIHPCFTLVISDQAKRMIRNILPNGLYDSNSKIRSSVAYTISEIAIIDWPNRWTELFDVIVKCLGGNEDSIHGGMQVLIEFTLDLNSQISEVGPIIISEVFRIFEADQVDFINNQIKIYSFKMQ